MHARIIHESKKKALVHARTIIHTYIYRNREACDGFLLPWTLPAGAPGSWWFPCCLKVSHVVSLAWFQRPQSTGLSGVFSPDWAPFLESRVNNSNGGGSAQGRVMWGGHTLRYSTGVKRASTWALRSASTEFEGSADFLRRSRVKACFSLLGAADGSYIQLCVPN